MVDAWTRAPGIVGGDTPEGEKGLLGGLLAGKPGAAVVEAVIMVVPGGQMRDRVAQPGKARVGGQPGIGLLEPLA